MDAVIIILVCCFPLLVLVWVEFESTRQRRKQSLDSSIKDLLTFGLRSGFLTFSEVHELEKVILKKGHSISSLERFHKALLNEILMEAARKAQRESRQRYDSKPPKKLHPVQKMLGLGKDFTQDELKKAYRKWMMSNHPDKNKDADTNLVQQVTTWYNQRKVK